MSAESTDEQTALDLGASEPRVRLEAIRRILDEPWRSLSSATLEALIGCLASADKLIQRRAVSALAGLTARDGRVRPRLGAVLTAGEPRMRWAAAYTLGAIEDGLDLAIQPVLLEALSDPDVDVRWAAAELMVRLGHKYPHEVRGGLLGLEAASDANSAKMALYCLRDLNFADPQVGALVKRASVGGANHVRLAALSLLGHLGNGSEEFAEIALRCLEEDGDAGVRRAAASALGRLKHRSERVVQALRRAAEHRADAALGRAARRALAQLERL